MSVSRSAGVYRKEIDRSQSPSPVSTSSAGIAVYSEKGEIGRAVLVTDGDSYEEKFGVPIKKYGFTGVLAKRFLRVGSELYVSRAVGGAYAFSNTAIAVVTIATDETDETIQLDKTAEGVFTDARNPDTIDFKETNEKIKTDNSYKEANSAFLIRAIGPGEAYNNIKIQINSSNMLFSGNVDYEKLEGGILINGTTYTYAVLAINELGATFAKKSGEITIDGSGGDDADKKSIQLSWNKVAGASGYLIYRKKGDGEFNRYASINQTNSSTVTFYDQGQFSEASGDALVEGTVDGKEELGLRDPDSPDDAKKPIAYSKSAEFQILVFDTNISVNTPEETWSVTFGDSIDGFGNQQEIEAVINNQDIGSKIIRVEKNTDYLPDTGFKDSAGNPIFYPSSKISLYGGDIGATLNQLTATEFNKALEVFRDPEDIQIRMLIEGGNRVVQHTLIDIATERLDCISILDMPSEYQEASAAISYRSNILNANTPRAAIYTSDLKVWDDASSTEMYIPPSGDIAATFAYTDRVSNVWESPAGLNRGILNIRGIRHSYKQDVRDRLARAQINMIKNSPALGLAVWEQLTLQSKLSANSYVSVRRMLDALQLAISATLQYQLQELPTDLMLRTVSNAIISILDPIQTGGGIKAYTIKTDASAGNNADTAMRGLLKIRLFIVPNIPVREIELTTIITKDTVAFEEVIPQAA